MFFLIKDHLEKIEKKLKDFLLDSEIDVEKVYKASSHLLFSGGKRLRPALCLLSCLIFEKDNEKLLEKAQNIAVAIEYIHSATLLHDDVIDNANLRRGKPSSNFLYGNEVAVLSGDYLFSQALKIIVENSNLDYLLLTLETIKKMVQGEIFQLDKLFDIDIKEWEYFYIISAKTARLMANALSLYPYFLKEDENSLILKSKLFNIGEYLGYAFQLIDDLLDYIGDEKTFGKPILNDIKEGKVTYPLLKALEKASHKEKEKVKDILEKIKNKSYFKEDLKYIKDIVIKYKGDKETLKTAKEFIEGAKKLILELPQNEYSLLLYNISDFIINRNY